ncbi:MAG: hypothetical protein ACO4CG_11445 [Prochlorothrix sp.]|nr:hypothetical protein [Prochlorothrix sp.]
MGAFQFGSSRQARLNQSAQLTHLNEHQHLIHRHRSPKSEVPSLTDAEIQHLKRRGVYIPPHAVTPDADRSRSLQSGENPTPHSASWWRQWVDWWESTRWEKTLEMVVQDLENLALLDLLAVTANITIVFSLWSFVADGPDREKQKHYQAWNVINSAALISSAPRM